MIIVALQPALDLVEEEEEEEGSLEVFMLAWQIVIM